jgi:fatty acid synthase
MSTAAAVARPATSLLAELQAGRRRAAVTFAGQGGDALAELSTLVAQRPELRAGLAVASAVLSDAAGSPAGQASGRFRHGVELVAWADDPDGAPPAAYLRSAAISYPLILVTQALLWRAVWEDGLADAMRAGAIVAAAGHSQGLLAALLVAEAGCDGVDDALLARYVRLAWIVGTHAALRAHAGSEPPLAAVSGVPLARLEPLLDAVNAEVGDGAAAAIALVNTPRQIVVGGPPQTLAVLRARLAEQARAESEQRRRGQRGGAPLRLRWSALGVDVAFHTPALREPSELLRAQLAAQPGALPDPAALALPVLSPGDGRDLRCGGDLAAAVASSQLVAAVRWDRVSRCLAGRGADWVIDFGPGTDVAALTAENLRGHGARTLALASPEGRRRLTSPGASPAGPDVRYASFAPGVVELPDGRRHLDGRYTRHTGRPPVILAGMTPTTADAPIVAAAANAGYAAELAGGGQPDRWTFERRIAELRELLEPGREVAFNTLLLDRHLWELHVGREQLVVQARRGGAPLAGLTVSAGIPDVEDALALLDELVAAGLHLNAFKPGTVEQVRQVLAIADAAPQHTIAVHVEGGRGGGHHSWEELDELLLETYHELRRRENVLLCVGGGIGDPERAAELLCGTWSLAYDQPAMPVDAVLVGTAAMACAEAAASPEVKRALVAASGSADWVPRGARAGGVTSARSNLNADIHLLDNAAAHVAHLLEQVAGDAAAVTARRAEIVAALAHTAKPYLGDVEAMSYRELLLRFAERCATGRHGRYDDGAWGHPSWRARALALYRRFGARLHPSESGPIGLAVARGEDLDDPAAALDAFCSAFPAAATTLLHPADAQYFLEVCDRPGKPVPFVPVLYGEVRRWFMADALWQAQDDRLPADGVFVIPGPLAVAGITRADEPIGELLARFEAEAIARTQAAGGELRRRDRLADPGPVPAPLARAIAGHGGPVAALCGAPSLLVAEAGVLRARPNPLWRVVVPGDEVHAVRDEGRRLARVEVLPAGASGERLEVAADGDDVVVTVQMPALDGPPALLVTRWRPCGAGSFVAVDGDAGTIAFARRVLGAGRASPPEHPLDAMQGVLGAGRASPPEHPLDAVQADWSCPAQLAAAHRAATGAAHDGIALDLALTLAWPALAALLSSAPFAARLAQLVHAGHAVSAGAAWPPRAGERGRVHARVDALDDPDGEPTRMTCHALLRSERGELATVEARLMTLGGAPVTDRLRHRRTAHDVELAPSAAEADWLAEQPWLGGVRLADGERLRLQVDCTTDEPRTGAATWSARGALLRDGEPAATVDWHAPAEAGHYHPVSVAIARLGPAAPARRPRPRVPLAEAHDAAPPSMDAFACIGGDHNPLHRCVLAARLGGLARPIVHGAWTAARASAFVVEALADGDGGALRRWRIDFVAPVALGAALELRAARVALQDGLEVVEVTVLADGELAAAGEALVAPPRTVLVFCGQGVQHRGLGADGRARSPAAREVWERADAHTRAQLGFSLLDVVERNPTELRLAGGRVLRHPDGVLQRTELTQPALVTLHAAQLAELREAGALGDDVRAAGHSVGELSALLALGVLGLEAALTLVHARGELMQRRVARDASGGSGYRMAAVDPSLAGLELDELETLVETIAELEIVNHNALGRQYGVAGTRTAVDALAQRLGRRAVRVLPGIDVPFHSSLLAPAVPALRDELERLVGPVDHRRLVGRWVPNVTGRAFALDSAAGDPDVLARRQVIDLLARQLAAPVRWVQTQRELVAPVVAGGLGARRIVELGPRGGPVLTGLMRSTLAVLELAGAAPELLHVERDRDAVLALQPAPEAFEATAAPPAAPAAPIALAPAAPETAPTAPVPAPAPVPVPETTAATVTAVPATETTAATTADRPLDAGTALRLVLAAQARVRPEQLDDDEPLDDVFQGASSRRNQVLLDLGREFGLSGAEGMPQQPIGELVRALREQGTHYRFPGAYLGDTVAAGLARALGQSGLSRGDAAAHLASAWDLGPGLADHVLALLALETRPGPSARGGPLGRLAGDAATTPAAGRELVDRAAALAGEALGIALARPAPAAASAPAPIDPVAAGGAVAHVEQALLASAQALVAGLGHDAGDGSAPAAAPDPAHERLALLDAELGPARAREIAPRFNHRRHVRFASAWASARWDLVGAYHDGLRGRIDEAALRRIAAHGADPVLAQTARFLAGRCDGDLADALGAVACGRATPELPPGLRPTVEVGAGGTISAGAVDDPARPHDLLPGVPPELRGALTAQPDLRGETALVTGASPGSIAAELVRRLLRGGATVVVATSTDTPARRRWYRELYRLWAGPGAVLHVLPANLASFADVDALAGWLARPASSARGRPDLGLDPLHPTLVAPFAAIATAGDLGAAGADSELALRLQLLGVQRLVGAVAAAVPEGAPAPTVLLALSPNHGGFGGDGAYGETKAALEVVLARWRSERSTWGSRVRIVAPRIGWVRGTGLMAANDAAAALVEERLGVRTFSAAEIGWLLCALAGPGPLRERAAAAPLEIDLTGGLAAIDDLGAAVAPLAAELRARAAGARRRAELDGEPAGEPVIDALPGVDTDAAKRTSASLAMPATAIDPAELVVIVGGGELGPCGSAAARFELEIDGALSPASVGELAWLCGLVAYERDGYRGRYVDAAGGAEVPESELAARYGEAVAARIGVRPLQDDGAVDASGLTVLAPVALSADVRIDVDGEQQARSFAAADPEHALVRHDPAAGTWHVLLRAGAQIRVPRRVAHSRRVAGQLPLGLDLARFGIPADLLATADRMALVNLACTVEAFADAGLTPEELLAAVHPALVANTQGCGMGGMASLRRLLLDHLLDAERLPDRLQESLGNVVAAHAVQSFVGSYGPMVHPVAACATAAVSLEEAYDKIRAGKALAVLAGGFDDLTPEGLTGFGDMGATASSDELDAVGIAPHEASRANDIRRRGFVEAQGGGALLVVRGDVALALGLPVRGVLAYAASFADGVHASIPAPGMGVLAVALGGTDSPLARALARLGLGADDIAVVSKHDTSTERNDPNEADLHERIQAALGRAPGNPLLVVSQKTVTGHAKGAAAAWQVDGMLRMMETGVVPGNRNLECADPVLRDGPCLTLGDHSLRLAEPLRAGLVTSLGFGHVSALLAIVHPDAFLAAVPAERREDYLRRAGRRRAEGVQQRLRTRLGRPAAVRRRDRRLGTDDPSDAREAEAALLTDPSVRLGPDGSYGTPGA